MTFTLCPECGNNLGEIVKFVSLAKQGLIQQVIKDSYADYSVDKIAFNKGDIEIGFILDLVGATMVCCRQHLIGARDNDTV
jgi:DNA-directed RNA polymerase subunit N (RpoN/RPB10)